MAMCTSVICRWSGSSSFPSREMKCATLHWEIYQPLSKKQNSCNSVPPVVTPKSIPCQFGLFLLFCKKKKPTCNRKLTFQGPFSGSHFFKFWHLCDCHTFSATNWPQVLNQSREKSHVALTGKRLRTCVLQRYPGALRPLHLSLWNKSLK